MCGILGQIEARQPVDMGSFANMLDQLRSRGPDDAGQICLDDGRVALGHRRLSIIDLSDAGHQPMPNEDKSIWLTFNGEIYNYKMLRSQLTAKGHCFRSHTDSEVILHAYEEWGDDCVAKLRGIFAFGIWDGPRRRLFLARDHLGVKPLYLWPNPQGLVFASDPRAIIEDPRFHRSVDRNALQHYLAYRYVPRDLSIFEGISKLSAGHRAVFSNGRLRCERYWEAQHHPTLCDPREAEDAVREAVHEAVTLQLVSDVPVGTFLSGGIDSTAVTGIASSTLSPPVSTFTIGFDDPGSDEREYARLAAEAMECEAHEEVLTREDGLSLITSFVDTYSEPFYDHSALPTYAVSRLARKHDTKVILSGDGADELFAGYQWYKQFLSADPRSRKRRILDALRFDPSGITVSRYFGLMGILDAKEQDDLLTFSNNFDHLDLFRQCLRGDVAPITQLQLMDINTFLVDDILTKVDRASMACGVEVRVPLLDLPLVELALSIDPALIFAGNERKTLFKKAVSHVIPDALLTNRKKGFSAPLPYWMAGGLEQWSAFLLRDGSLVQRGLFDAAGVDRLLAQRQPTTTWLLLVAELWARRWLEGETPDPTMSTSAWRGIQA
jgi:asparagine synthase (glutamine-hydrolysing)